MTKLPFETIREVIEALDNVERGMTFDSSVSRRFVPYAALGPKIRGRGASLASAGVGQGHRVVLILPDEQQFVETFFGALSSGIVPVPLFPPFMLTQLDTYFEHVRRVMGQCQATAIVTIPQIAELLRSSQQTLPIVLVDELSGEDIDPPPVAPESLAFIQYTSGSTSSPKGVAVTHRALVQNTMAFVERMQIDPERDRGVTWLPLYHDMGLIGGTLMPLLLQASVWYMQPLEFARHPMSWCELIHEVRGTIQFAPNFAYSFLSRRATDERLRELDLSCWRIAGCGAEPIRPEVMRMFEERFAPAGFRPTALLPCYGLAEATLAVALSEADEPWRSLRLDAESLRRTGAVRLADGEDREIVELVSCGRAIPEHEIRIVDESGALLGEDVDGEIEVRGPCVMAGYYEDRVSSEWALRNGWLRTGDRGFVHRGNLYVTGRVSDMLIVNGRNIHPQDIEWCVAAIDGVRQGNTVVFGRESQDSEELVVVLEGATDADVAALARSVVGRVGAECGLRVSEVVVLEKGALPKTTSGKLRRRATRDAYLSKRLPVLQEA